MFSMQSVSLNPLIATFLVFVCNFFEFGTVLKWCIREWVNQCQGKIHINIALIYSSEYLHDF